MASELALQCSNSWTMKTHILGAGQFVDLNPWMEVIGLGNTFKTYYIEICIRQPRFCLKGYRSRCNLCPNFYRRPKTYFFRQRSLICRTNTFYLVKGKISCSILVPPLNSTFDLGATNRPWNWLEDLLYPYNPRAYKGERLKGNLPFWGSSWFFS